LQIQIRIHIRADPHYFLKMDPDPDPHYSEKLDPDPERIKVKIRRSFRGSKLWRAVDAHNAVLKEAQLETLEGLQTNGRRFPSV
jgi:hypothetical protein